MDPLLRTCQEAQLAGRRVFPFHASKPVSVQDLLALGEDLALNVDLVGYQCEIEYEPRKFFQT